MATGGQIPTGSRGRGRLSAAALAAALLLPAGWTDAQGTREEQLAAGLYETGLSAQMPTDADCPPISLGFGTSLNRSGRKRTAAHGTIHAGVDWAMPEGTPILAIADGRVIQRGEDLNGPRGNFVAIEHDGPGGPLYSSYVHLSGFNVEQGQEVRRGQVIGAVGITGRSTTHEHLHLNVYGSEVHEVGGRRWRYRYDYLQFLSGDMTRIDPAEKRARQVPVAFLDQDGRVHPADARVIWPFPCRTKAAR